MKEWFKKIRQWLKSKTINFGLLLQLAAVAQTYYDGLGNPIATAIVGAIVIVLRAKTTQALGDK